MLMPTLVKEFEPIREDAEHGPWHHAQFKTLKIYAQGGFPGAHELMQKCLRDGLKKKKAFRRDSREAPATKR
jgi:hypothetical protein